MIQLPAQLPPQANQGQAQPQNIPPPHPGAMIYKRIRQNLAQEYTQF